MIDREEPEPLEPGFEDVADRLRSHSRLLVCLDFDGTLAPIVEDPDDAAMSPANREALSDLIAEPASSVAVISGRELEDVRRRVDEALSSAGVGQHDTEVTIAGNHGLEIRRERRTAVHPVAAARADSLRAVCASLDACLEAVPNYRVENKGLTGAVHVRSVPEPAREVVRRKTRRLVDRFAGEELAWSTGKRVIEITPALEWGKGDAVELVRADLPADALTIYVGDDTTDEHAFAAVEPEGVGVLVGGARPSRASKRVDSPAEVAELLRWLATDGVDALAATPGDLERSTGPTAGG